MSRKRSIRLTVALGSLLLAQPALALSPEQLQLALHQPPDQAACSVIERASTAERQRLEDFYRERAHRPLWDAEHHAQLQRQLQALADDGLNPRRYPLPAAGQQDACSELQSSLRYLQALDELANGVLPAPLPEIWHRDGPPPRIDPLGIARSTPDDQLATAFERARPDLALYQQLRSHYARLRQLPPPSWPLVDPGPLLRPGASGERVQQLAARLSAEGYLQPGTDESSPHLFDAQLQAALQQFQQRHSLQDDGVLGPDTLRELNVPARQRVEQLRINLERWRWLYRELEADLVLVDIAGGEGTLLHQGLPVWHTRLQVGRPERQTPQLKSRITRLTLNPTWTVPPTILHKDKLPEIRRDRGYLARHRLRVLGSDGHPRDPGSVDWSNPRGITLRQDAGPDNALGQIAFRFDNPFAVYLHDTPSQRLFDKRPRVFSSGCVRVENAMQLRDLLTAALDSNAKENLLGLQASGRTSQFRLEQAYPVLTAYWTVSVDDGGLVFRPDLYELDGPLSDALDMAGNPAAPPVMRPKQE